MLVQTGGNGWSLYADFAGTCWSSMSAHYPSVVQF
jgi:hypothetical protein